MSISAYHGAGGRKGRPYGRCPSMLGPATREWPRKSVDTSQSSARARHSRRKEVAEAGRDERQNCPRGPGDSRFPAETRRPLPSRVSRTAWSLPGSCCSFARAPSRQTGRGPREVHSCAPARSLCWAKQQASVLAMARASKAVVPQRVVIAHCSHHLEKRRGANP